MNSDTIYCILNYLSLHDILTCILINKQFNKVSKCELIWKGLSNKDFPDKIDKNYYENYASHYKLNKFLQDHSMSDMREHLGLSVQQLSSLPSEIGLLTNLESLQLPINNLKSLPSSICSLTNLKMLDISWNKLESLPEEIELLTKLRHIEIQMNNIEDIPLLLSRLSKLTNLQTLMMDQNQISKVPIELLTKFRQIKNITKN